MGNMNPTLAELKDIHLPEALAWWDMAWGWWGLVFLGLTLLVAAAYQASVIQNFYQKKKAKQALLQAVHDALLSIQTAYQKQKNHALLLTNLSTYLRRVCLSLFPQENTAGLIEDAWLSFLDEQWGEMKPKIVFSDKKIAYLLKNGAYQASFTEKEKKNIEDLLQLTEQWSTCVVQRHV